MKLQVQGRGHVSQGTGALDGQDVRGVVCRHYSNSETRFIIPGAASFRGRVRVCYMRRGQGEGVSPRTGLVLVEALAAAARAPPVVTLSEAGASRRPQAAPGDMEVSVEVSAAAGDDTESLLAAAAGTNTSTVPRAAAEQENVWRDYETQRSMSSTHQLLDQSVVSPDWFEPLAKGDSRWATGICGGSRGGACRGGARRR